MRVVKTPRPGLSGAVQTSMSREAMQRKLDHHRSAAVARASAYRTASSSCSGAASTMAKSLFAKGADFVAATVFIFAPTNLASSWASSSSAKAAPCQNEF